MTAHPVSWLAEPWAGAFLVTVADPLAACDGSLGPAELPGWPAALPVASVLRDLTLRGRVARWRLPEPAAKPILEACRARPGTRLALLPGEEALWLMARAAAWLDAPRIAGLLRRSAVDEVRAGLGADAYAFALAGAPLLPQPLPALREAVADADGDGTLRRGAALFGLALGPAPVPLLDRLRLRTPLPIWAEVAHRAEANDSEAVRDGAFRALRRIARERGAPWLGWLN